MRNAMLVMIGIVSAIGFVGCFAALIVLSAVVG